MKEIIAILLFAVIFFPQFTGNIAHKTWNDLRIGWQQVQDK